MDPDADPDRGIFVTLKVHLHHFSKIKSYKEVTELENSRNQCFSYYFCLMIEESGSVSLTNPDPDRGGPKTFGPGPGPDPQH
jgi:hypothetical protein